MTYYFEDLEVGDTFTAGSYTVTKAEIIEFAEQFDPQPFHVDEEAARESLFGELVASGLHTLCISVRLFVTEFVRGEEGIANMGGLGMDDLQWHRPVTPGDTLSLRIEVLETSPSTSHSGRGYVDFERVIHTDDGERVLSLLSHNIVERRQNGG
ncbi:MaoC family dehydratase [Halomarina halobia]|uniref:MaoC family dehydratase n=1 Tax=Halomarina halobia TaxID=3033386 RepID=A0ABD6AEU6_9EURY|nr:MaoC family dehydratase [Halomarina sp. PSR21]